MTDETQAVLDAETARCAAIGANDMAALSDLLADDYLHVYGGGGTSDKPGYIDAVTRAPRVPERSDLRVRFYGEVAVLTGNLLNRIHYPDRGPEVLDTFVTQVLHKQDGRWRFVSFQITQKPKKAA